MRVSGPTGAPAGGIGLATDATPMIVYVSAANGGRPNVRERLARTGLEVVAAHDLAEAQRLLAAPGAVALIDLAGDRAALSMIHALRAGRPHLPIGAVADPNNPFITGEVMNAGVLDILTWPFDLSDAAAMAANLRDRMDAAVGLDAQPTGGEWLFSQSPAMQQVLERVREVSERRGGVCLCGERGTGRLLIARAIHGTASQRDAGPFVVVDCADESPDDLEQRLFGLSDRRNGKADAPGVPRLTKDSAVVAADGGTLVLRNVVEAPNRVQAKLARILRDGEVTLADRRSSMALDIRPVAIVDPTVDSAVADGRLRKDLHSRLIQAHIDVPPLRRRREDIPQLAVYFLRQACESQRIAPKRFTRSALKLLMALPWHGNAAELKGLMETVVRTVPRPMVQLDDLLERATLDGVPARLDAGVSLRDAKARFERDCIVAVLMRHHGRMGEAARALGIQRTNLYRKVRQLNVARSLFTARR